jgi:hypothetical protein
VFRQRASCLRHAEHKRPGKKSGADDLEEAPRWIGYSLKPLDKIPSSRTLRPLALRSRSRARAPAGAGLWPWSRKDFC